MLPTTFALWNPIHRRFVTMSDRWLGKSPIVNDGTLPSVWTWEQFTAVDGGTFGGGPTVGLYSTVHQRFFSMHADGNPFIERSPQRPDGSLPAGWAWERFRVIDGGNGQVGFWSPTHRRFIRMPNTDRLDRSGVSSDGSLPTGWGWEQFRVVDVSGGSPPAPAPTPLPCSWRREAPLWTCQLGRRTGLR